MPSQKDTESEGYRVNAESEGYRVRDIQSQRDTESEIIIQSQRDTKSADTLAPEHHLKISLPLADTAADSAGDCSGH